MSEFKNLPSEWKVMRLGDVAEKSILKNRNNLIKLVLSNSAIDGLVAQNEYFDKDIANKENIQDYYIVDLGDFVYNPRISQSAPTGPINRNMLSKGIVSPLYTVFTVQDEILAKFLAYFFKTIVWQNQVKSVANYGARYDRINITDNAFFSLKILLPPLDEQEKIAEILSTWDEAINLTINLIESKKQFKKALMQNLLTAKIRFPQFKGEWKFTKLGNLLDYEQPTQYLVSDENYDNGFGTPVLTAGKTFILGYTNETKGIFQDNLPVIIFDDFTTATQFVNFPFKVKSSAMKILKQKNTMVNIRLVYEMMQMINFVASDHKRYWISEFQDLEIKLPNLNEQQKIAEVLTACDDEINLLNLKLENLKKQKQGLMQKLLSGKVRAKYV